MEVPVENMHDATINILEETRKKVIGFAGGIHEALHGIALKFE